ncbi:MAG: electron transfer flavoprotein subunit beta/FixA family protein [Syntrophales bacterium]
MNIIVCIKQVPDPEIPPARFQIDPEGKKVLPPEGVAPVISVFDERAVEVALRLKDKHQAKVTVITIGPPAAKKAVRYALSMGADTGIHVQQDMVEEPDSFESAHILARAIEKAGEYSLILCGRQAADWDAGQVGSIIAENLGIPVLTVARKVDLIDGKWRVESVIQDGYRIMQTPMPALVTVSSEIGLPRLPTGIGIIKATKAKIIEWSLNDIGADLSGIRRSEILKLYIPVREAKCHIVEADTVPEAAQKLALRLREVKII